LTIKFDYQKLTQIGISLSRNFTRKIEQKFDPSQARLTRANGRFATAGVWRRNSNTSGTRAHPKLCCTPNARPPSIFNSDAKASSICAIWPYAEYAKFFVGLIQHYTQHFEPPFLFSPFLFF
jgi:hypothetical protein